jgi:hypothetical protein
MVKVKVVVAVIVEEDASCPVTVKVYVPLGAFETLLLLLLPQPVKVKPRVAIRSTPAKTRIFRE